jgi:hypothetical protein
MKKLFFLLMIAITMLSTSINFAQEFNGYKYIVIPDLVYNAGKTDVYQLSQNTREYFRKRGFNVVNPVDVIPAELKNNPCLGLILNINHDYSKGLFGNESYVVSFDFVDCQNKNIKNIKNSCSQELISAENNYKKSLKRCLKDLDNMKYVFNGDLTPKIEYPEVENINMDEVELKNYFDNNKLDELEGIYKTYKSENVYKVGILKQKDIYKAFIIESELPQWKKGDVKAIFEKTSVLGVYSVKYYFGDKSSIEVFANSEGSLITIELKNEKGEDSSLKLIKLYPIR